MTTINNQTQSTIVAGATSPLTITIPPHSTPIALVITSAAAITVTGQTGPGHATDIGHTP